MHHRSHGLAVALASLSLGLPLQALGQGRADPADPAAPAPALAHRSAFADYKPFQDIAPGDWRRLNDTVGRAALKPAAAPPVVPAPAASAPGRAAPPVPPPTPGHHQHLRGGRP